jgi:uncharacterized membrane protein
VSAAAAPVGGGTVPARHARPRIESLSDMVFGLALSLGAIALVANPPSNATTLYTDLATFGFGFLVLIAVWLAYTRLMTASAREGVGTVHLNVALLFVVSIEPFLLNVLVRAGSSSAFFEAVSQAYAIDVGVMVALLGLFAWALANAGTPSVTPPIRGYYRREARNRWLAGGLFFISAAPPFGLTSASGLPIRVWIWILAIAIVWATRVSRAASHTGDSGY